MTEHQHNELRPTLFALAAAFGPCPGAEGLYAADPSLINNRTREKNRFEAHSTTNDTPQPILDDIQDTVTALSARIDNLRSAALAFARGHDDISTAVDLLTTVKGIGKASALEILGEVLCMPADLTAKQLVAQAGLDPS